MSKRRSPNYGDQAAQARRACERLGTDVPACAICGETRAIILEKHHIAGKKYDPETMVLCRNHHGLVTAAQLSFPPNISDPPNQLERIARMLLNLAELFVLLVDKLREAGLYLLELSLSETRNGDST